MSDNNPYNIYAPQPPWYKRVNWISVLLVLAIIAAVVIFTGIGQMAYDKVTGKEAVTAEE